KKEPSKENRSDLKKALASVMNGKDEDVQAQKENKKSSDYEPFAGAHGKPFKKWPNSNPTKNSKNKTQDKVIDEVTPKKEVPEDVLKKMLDVEGKDKQI
ncbi:MAG: hypothetical protein CMI57_03075, partial [Parcubacteria group bacterium]|nr:hypothetical protein [Parcubacteria group bacterium]